MSRGSMRFALLDLPPAMRAQVEDKLAAQGTTRLHLIRQPGEGEEPAKLDDRGRPKLASADPAAIEHMKALDAQNVSRTVIAKRFHLTGSTVARLLGRKRSALEKQLHRQLHDAGLTGWEAEYRFHPERL